MVEAIYSKGLIVTDPGDPKAGIPATTWHISGDFEFDNFGQMIQFKNRLAKAWEYGIDTPVLVETLEERETAISKRKSLMIYDLTRTLENNFDRFPLPIESDPVEEQKALLQRKDNILQLVKRYLRRKKIF